MPKARTLSAIASSFSLSNLWSENILLSTLLICFLSFSACKANIDQTEKLEDESHYATVYISLNTPAFENYNSISSERTATPVLPSAIT